MWSSRRGEHLLPDGMAVAALPAGGPQQVTAPAGRWQQLLAAPLELAMGLKAREEPGTSSGAPLECRVHLPTMSSSRPREIWDKGQG